MRFLKLIPLLLVLLPLSSCESVEDAQKTADKFFEAYNNVDKETMNSLLDKETVIEAGIKDDFYDVFSKHQNSFGKVTEHKRYGFKNETNNGIHTVTLRFTCQTEQGTEVYEKLKLVKRGNEYKIFEYAFNTDKNVIDKEN